MCRTHRRRGTVPLSLDLTRQGLQLSETERGGGLSLRRGHRFLLAKAEGTPFGWLRRSVLEGGIRYLGPSGGCELDG